MIAAIRSFKKAGMKSNFNRRHYEQAIDIVRILGLFEGTKEMVAYTHCHLLGFIRGTSLLLTGLSRSPIYLHIILMDRVMNRSVTQ